MSGLESNLILKEIRKISWTEIFLLNQ